MPDTSADPLRHSLTALGTRHSTLRLAVACKKRGPVLRPPQHSISTLRGRLASSTFNQGLDLADILCVDETRPGQVIFYEVWESPKAQQDYMAWRVQAGDLTRLLSLLAGEPRFTALRSIAA